MVTTRSGLLTLIVASSTTSHEEEGSSSPGSWSSTSMVNETGPYAIPVMMVTKFGPTSITLPVSDGSYVSAACDPTTN